MPTLPLPLFFMDALARITQIIGRKQNIYRCGIVSDRESAQSAAQQCDQHSERKIARVAPERFREGRENPQPAARLPDLRARRGSIIQFGVGPCHEPFEILSQLVSQRSMGDSIQVCGSKHVKLLQLFSLPCIQPAVWPALQQGQ